MEWAAGNAVTGAAHSMINASVGAGRRSPPPPTAEQWTDSGSPALPASLANMAERSRGADAGAAGTIVVFVPTMMCRRCVRVVSRRIRDVQGVVSLEVDAARGLLRVRGDVAPVTLLAALTSAGLGGCEMLR